MGCYQCNQIRVLVCCQLMGSALFLGGCNTSREVLRPRRPDSAKQRGDALEDPLCVFKAFCSKLWKEQVMR